MTITQLRRVAAGINLIAAVVFLSLGFRSGRTAYMVIGTIFLLIGILRLVQIKRGTPPPT